MKKLSAGILLYRLKGPALEVLLVHPGGPFWAKKDKNVWSIPKGEFTEGENPLDAARREFSEELGFPPPEGEMLELGTVKQASGKVVHIWAAKGDLDVSKVTSNTIEIEWPPKTGQKQQIPEVDRAQWCSLVLGKQKLLKGQWEFLDRLAEKLGVPAGDESQEVEEQQTSLF